MLYFYDTGETFETTQTVSVYEDPLLAFPGLLEAEVATSFGLGFIADTVWAADRRESTAAVDVSDRVNLIVPSGQTLHGAAHQMVLKQEAELAREIAELLGVLSRHACCYVYVL